MQLTPEQAAIFKAIAAETAQNFMRILFQQFPQLAQAVVAPHTVRRVDGPELVTQMQLLAEVSDNMQDLNSNLELMIDVQVSIAKYTGMPRKESDALMRMVRERRSSRRRRGG